MSVKGAFWSVFGMAYASVKAPYWALDLPSFGKVTLTKAIVVPDGDSGDPHDGTKWVATPHEQLCLEGTVRERRHKWDWNWKIDIDTSAGVVERADWHHLTPKNGGSHGWDLLIMFLGIPGLILASPVLVPWWCLRWLLSKATGMDLHRLVTWIKLRSQLPREHRELVLRAFRNMNTDAHWRYRELRRAEQAQLSTPA